MRYTHTKKTLKLILQNIVPYNARVLRSLHISATTTNFCTEISNNAKVKVTTHNGSVSKLSLSGVRRIIV